MFFNRNVHQPADRLHFLLKIISLKKLYARLLIAVYHFQTSYVLIKKRKKLTSKTSSNVELILYLAYFYFDNFLKGGEPIFSDTALKKPLTIIIIICL